MPTVYGDDNEEIKNYELMATKEYCNFLWQSKKCYKFWWQWKNSLSLFEASKCQAQAYVGLHALLFRPDQTDSRIAKRPNLRLQRFGSLKRPHMQLDR